MNANSDAPPVVVVDDAHPGCASEGEPCLQHGCLFTEKCIHGADVLLCLGLEPREARLENLRRALVLQSPLAPEEGVGNKYHESPARQLVRPCAVSVVLLAKIDEGHVLAFHPHQLLLAVREPAAVVVQRYHGRVGPPPAGRNQKVSRHAIVRRSGERDGPDLVAVTLQD